MGKLQRLVTALIKFNQFALLDKVTIKFLKGLVYPVLHTLFLKELLIFELSLKVLIFGGVLSLETFVRCS